MHSDATVEQDMPPQSLSGLKVLDLSGGITGPNCTKHLSDYGAETIKVEPPEGDVARRAGPFPGDLPHPEKSGIFLHLNTNKRGVTLNLNSVTGQRIIRELVPWADVVVEDFSPGTMASLGLSYEALSEVNPMVIMVSITPFGQTGPYKDMKGGEIIIHGMGGAMHAQGNPEREPTKYAEKVALRHAGVVAATATMVAVFARDTRGSGEHVDLSMYETQAASQDRRTAMTLAHQYTGDIFGRRPLGFAIASGIFPCADGYIQITGGGKWFPSVPRMLGRPELLEDPRFSTPVERSKPENIEAFNYEILLPWLMDRTMKEAWTQAQAARLMSAPVFTSRDLLEDEHFASRGMWTEIEHPAAGTFTYPGRPFIMSETPWLVRRPAPLLGQHNGEVYCDMLGYERDYLVRLRQGGVI